MRVKGPTISNVYHSWLCDFVGVNKNGYSYHILMRDLYLKKFKWFVPNDDNRAFEGKNLRELFCEEENLEFEFDYFDEGVSMLELIASLAIRCNDMMSDMIHNMSISDWFWKLLSNVELDKFNDDDYYDLGGSSLVNDILDRIIHRTYHRSGKGGLFPLKFNKKDQRKVELWYQMNFYLVENFYDV